MNIVTAGKADMLTIEKISQASGYPVPELALDEEGIRKMFDKKEIILLAKEAGDPVGYVAIDPNHNTRAEIYSLEVKKEYHDKGIGSELLKEAEKHIVEMGKEEIFLFVHPRNREAIPFYETNGYKKKGLVPDHYSTGEPGVLLLKKIK